jgi:uncharacterized membrane protein
MSTRTYSTIIIVLALLGLADAAYLSDMAFAGASLTCNIAGLDGCNVVAQSVYSKVFGLPLALYGVMFYSIFILSFVVSLLRPHHRLFLFVALIGLAGVLFSTYFLYIQVVLIKALCVYCIGSAFIAYMLGILTYRRYSQNKVVTTVPIADYS